MNKISLFLEKGNQKESLEQLKELVGKAGISLSLEEKGSYTLACFEVDEKQFLRKNTRYAGRPEIITEKKYTVGDIRHMKEEMTVEEMAKILKLSRRTIFRRLQNHQYDPDEFIF